MTQGRVHRSTSSQSLKVTLITSTPSLPISESAYNSLLTARISPAGVLFWINGYHNAELWTTRDEIQLIYHGSKTANHILNEGCFDKAIHAHLVIDAVIYFFKRHHSHAHLHHHLVPPTRPPCQTRRSTYYSGTPMVSATNRRN